MYIVVLWFGIFPNRSSGLLELVVERCHSLNVILRDYFNVGSDWLGPRWLTCSCIIIINSAIAALILYPDFFDWFSRGSISRLQESRALKIEIFTYPNKVNSFELMVIKYDLYFTWSVSIWRWRRRGALAIFCLLLFFWLLGAVWYLIPSIHSPWWLLKIYWPLCLKGSLSK